MTYPGKYHSTNIKNTGVERDLARRQLTSDVYAFICTYLDEHGYSPTTREIMRGLGRNSNSTIARHLRTLERDGWIKVTHDANGAICTRAIALTDKAYPVFFSRC